MAATGVAPGVSWLVGCESFFLSTFDPWPVMTVKGFARGDVGDALTVRCRTVGNDGNNWLWNKLTALDFYEHVGGSMSSSPRLSLFVWLVTLSTSSFCHHPPPVSVENSGSEFWTSRAKKHALPFNFYTVAHVPNMTQRCVHHIFLVTKSLINSTCNLFFFKSPTPRHPSPHPRPKPTLRP